MNHHTAGSFFPATTPSPAIGVGNATTTTTTTVAAATTTTTTTTPTSATTNSTIGYRMGHGLVQARISPMNHPSSQQKRRFFSPNQPSSSTSASTNRNATASTTPRLNDPSHAAAAAATGITTSASTTTAAAAAGGVTVTTTPLILHGINITHLRSLTQSCLGNNNNNNSNHNNSHTTAPVAASSPSPSMAVFFASIVYSKTKQWDDAFIYAQALINNGQHKRAVQWIHQVGLLTCYSHHHIHNDEYSSSSSESLQILQLESILLAATALAAIQDWNAILTLLEETQYYTTVVPTTATTATTTATSLDDDDDIAWQQLAQAISNINVNSISSTTTTTTTIHPLARICSLRGRAYSELGHPLRAATYWKKALTIDPLCVDALEGLLDKSVVEPSVALQTVLQLDFSTTSSTTTTNNDPTGSSSSSLDWLRALYLARVHVAAPTGGMVQEGTPAAVALATSMSMDHGIDLSTTTTAAQQQQQQQNPQDDDDDNDDDDNHDEENEPMDSNTAMPLLPLSAQHQQQQHSTTTTTSAAAAAASRNRQSTGSFASAMGSGVSGGGGAVTDAFWHDASSSIQLLTPIPQQPSVADMSAASSSSGIIFFANTTNNNNRSIPGRTSFGETVPEDQPLFQPTGSSSDPILPQLTRNNNNNYSTEAEAALSVLWNKHQLQHSPEVLAMAAQQAFSKYDWKNALRYCQELRKIDPLSQNSNKAAYCHVSTLVQLRQKRSLFRLAHEWVDASPKEARSWFAVGAYYYACQRYHVAQRHFCRATRLDPQCVEAWIAFGASFAACDESDQALASFRAAQRLAPGNHISLLYIGMEYLRTNHLVLAGHFLSAANDSSNGTDALAKSELGVLNMYQKKYDSAIAWFLQALGCSVDLLRKSAKHNPESLLDLDSLGMCIDSVQDEYWESTLFNLSHAYRKQRLYDHAIVCLERCLALKESSSAYSALAYCLHLQAMSLPLSQTDESNALLHQAIDTYHQALSKKPDAAFSSEMLSKALSDALEQTDFFASNQENDAGGNNNNSSSNIDVHDGISGESFASSKLSNRDGGPTSSRLNQSSLWTDDGLSLSVESASDIDMS
ncbi:expressed tetratricopeptide repeat protein [Nitzschia inconspicua]|uniref:Expressed tetratricopeptide repeat protein n=1 Tax=Nitzschia inconspicua TaxID=303405 RepID=A0A9K3KX75_9STRA|nr:expressed tetratricopeptide repeat protein [Nitzschia inconspicua]